MNKAMQLKDKIKNLAFKKAFRLFNKFNARLP
jgi:hypothetical protein